MANIAMF